MMTLIDIHNHSTKEQKLTDPNETKQAPVTSEAASEPDFDDDDEGIAEIGGDDDPCGDLDPANGLGGDDDDDSAFIIGDSSNPGGAPDTVHGLADAAGTMGGTLSRVEGSKK